MTENTAIAMRIIAGVVFFVAFCFDLFLAGELHQYLLVHYGESTAQTGDVIYGIVNFLFFALCGFALMICVIFRNKMRKS